MRYSVVYIRKLVFTVVAFFPRRATVLTEKTAPKVTLEVTLCLAAAFVTEQKVI